MSDSTIAKTLGISDYQRLAKDFKQMRDDLDGLRLKVVTALPENPDADVMYIIKDSTDDSTQGE